MGLNWVKNKKSNMYQFIDATWNAIKGECPHGCLYCYMHKWGKQNQVHLDEKEFKTDLGTGNFIFVGSSCDMFAKDIPKEWIQRTLDYCFRFDNKYLFQSKNPKRFSDFYFGHKDTVFCTTIETNRWYPDIMNNCSTPQNRAYNMPVVNYVTIEPIMDFDIKQFVELIRQCYPVQVNIGADSGNNNLPEPPKEKVLELILKLEKFTTVKLKSNLKRLLK